MCDEEGLTTKFDFLSLKRFFIVTFLMKQIIIVIGMIKKYLLRFLSFEASIMFQKLTQDSASLFVKYFKGAVSQEILPFLNKTKLLYLYLFTKQN